MVVYLAEVIYNDYEEDWFTIGIYSTKENAKKAIVNYLRNEENQDILDYDTYNRMEDADYTVSISRIVVDENYFEYKE